MKQGRSIVELAQEIQRQAGTKRDYLAPTKALEMVSTPDSNNRIAGILDDPLPLNQNAHNQLATKLGIPTKYYNRMREEVPELVDQNVNTWLQRSDNTLTLRQLDGDIRAVLSDRYRPLDNVDLASAVLPQLVGGELSIVSCEITSSHLYIKALSARITADISVGDTVQAGVVISNSETGQGSLRVEPLLFRLICTNGMISENALRKYHVGRGNGADIESVLSVEARSANDEAFWLSVRDVVNSAFNKDIFEGLVDKFRDTKDQKITGDVGKVVEVTTKHLGFSQDIGTSILNQLASGGDLSRYGMINAITRTSQDVEDYELATELERAGGKILELPQRQWNSFAIAA